MNRQKFQSTVISKLALKGDKLDEHDFAEFAKVLIEDTSGAPPLSVDDDATLARIFGPRRNLQRLAIDELLDRQRIKLDAEADETLELLLNPGVFIHQMSEIIDPATGKPLVQKEVRTLKKKKMKALFASIAPVDAAPATAEESAELGDSTEGEAEITGMEPPAQKPAPRPATRR